MLRALISSTTTLILVTSANEADKQWSHCIHCLRHVWGQWLDKMDRPSTVFYCFCTDMTTIIVMLFIFTRQNFDTYGYLTIRGANDLGFGFFDHSSILIMGKGLIINIHHCYYRQRGWLDDYAALPWGWGQSINIILVNFLFCVSIPWHEDPAVTGTRVLLALARSLT